MDIRELALDDLVLDPNLSLRDRIDEFVVDGRPLVADGFHRHAAAVLLGKATIRAAVIEGTFDEALDFASTVNLFHGLPLSRAERRRAVDVKLRLHPDWSDRRMAEELGVSRQLVAKARQGLVDARQIPDDPGRIGADGKTYASAGRRERGRRGDPGAVVAEPAIDEMLGLMTRRLMEVLEWTRAEGFTTAYRSARANSRGLFQAATIKLSARADQLRKA